MPSEVGRGLEQTLVLDAAAACDCLSPILVSVEVRMERGVGGGSMTQPSPPPVLALMFLVSVVVSPVCLESSAALIVWGVLRFALKPLLVIVLIAVGRVRGGGGVDGSPPPPPVPAVRGGVEGGSPGGGVLAHPRGAATPPRPPAGEGSALSPAGGRGTTW